MRLLVVAGSLRRESFNRKLAALAARAAAEAGAEVDHADFREFEMPMYDGDLEAASGLPEGALKLKARVEAAGAIILSTPEYNWGVPGTVKNAIDWVSRARPMPWKDKPMLVLSASPGPYGGIRSVLQLRQVLAAVGALAHPDSLNLARAGEAFDDAGELKDPAMAQRLAKTVGTFLTFAAAVAK